MHTACSRLVAPFAAILFLAACMTPARAATIDSIAIKSAADLTLPAENVPAGFTSNPSNGRVIDNAMMLTVLGKHINYVFHKDGWTTGYHGWLDANNPAGDAFVTYDFYGFKKSGGAHAAVGPFLRLVLGVQNPVNDNRLPSNATVFIDGTGTYDPAAQPFTVVEIVFQVDNVLADVTGYYSGGDAGAADQATATAIEATAGLSDWLQTQSHPAQQSSMVWPIVPFMLLLPGRRYWSRRRGT